MSEIAFRELESQVKALSLGQLLKLQKTFEKNFKRKKSRNSKKKVSNCLTRLSVPFPAIFPWKKPSRIFRGKAVKILLDTNIVIDILQKKRRPQASLFVCI